jgi:hypothetical protein
VSSAGHAEGATLKHAKLSQLDQPGVGRREAASVEVKRSKMILEVNVEPVATAGARCSDSGRD